MKKFERVETPDYILAVSDETPIYPEPYYVSNSLGDRVEHAETKPSGIIKKIIGYQPKGNVPELDLPLLPEQPTRKTFSEKDMRAAFDRGVEVGIYLSDYKNDEVFNEFLKWIKKPKWFVAETKQKFQPDKNKRTDVKNGVYYELKTETNSEGKQVLKGHYL